MLCLFVVYPHALKASQSPQRSQRSQRPHRFERLNLAAAKKRGHIIHQRDLNTTRTQLPLGFFVFFLFSLLRVSGGSRCVFFSPPPFRNWFLEQKRVDVTISRRTHHTHAHTDRAKHNIGRSIYIYIHTTVCIYFNI